MRPKRMTDLALQAVGEETLVLDLNNHVLHQLNATANWIFSCCDGKTTVATMVSELVARYQLDRGAAEKDILDTLEQLARKRLVSLNGAEERNTCPKPVDP